MTKNRIEKYYDDYGESYENERREGYFGFVNALEFDKIRAAITDNEVLEVGCGTGLILERTQRLASSAIGIDLSDGMLMTARHKNLVVKKSNVTELDFPDGSFDVVYSFKVLPHVPDIKKAVKEITRVTKPNGRIFLEFYNPYSVKAITNLVLIVLRGKKPVYNRFDSLTMIRSYIPAGWEIKSTRGVRIFAALGAFYTLPGISAVFRYLDWNLCDSIFRFVGSYLIVELGQETSS